MSILLARLLRQAEAKLVAGAHDEAETVSCQVLGGAATLKDVALTRDAALLLHRIPLTDQQQRRVALMEMGNFIAAMQTGTDREGALALCDAMLPLTEGLLYEKLHVLELALYISGSIGMLADQHPSYNGYLDQLIRLERRPAGIEVSDPDLVQTAATPAETISRVLAERGAVLLRQLFRPEQLAPWRDAGDALLTAEATQTVVLSRLGDPATLLDRDQTHLLATALQPFFFFPPKICLPNCFLRRVSAQKRETTVPFHQDVNAFGKLMVNVWTPLVACGEDAPGLEVIARRTPIQVETGSASTQYDELQITEQLVYDRFGEDAVFGPAMQPGDVLMFLSTTIHRTRVSPAMTRERLSIELRFDAT